MYLYIGFITVLQQRNLSWVNHQLSHFMHPNKKRASFKTVQFSVLKLCQLGSSCCPNSLMVSFCLGCPLSASVPYVPGTGLAKVHQHWGNLPLLPFYCRKGEGQKLNIFQLSCLKFYLYLLARGYQGCHLKIPPQLKLAPSSPGSVTCTNLLPSYLQTVLVQLQIKSAACHKKYWFFQLLYTFPFEDMSNIFNT